MSNDEVEWDDTPEGEEQGWTGAWRRKIDREDRHTYKLLRANFRAQCVAARAVCWLCRGGIDYSLKHGDAMAWELDHFVPVSVDESLALTPSNFRASHAVHNRQRAVSGVPSGAGGDESGWPTAVIDGVEGRYDPELGPPSEWW
jgi:hypothetical protein